MSVPASPLDHITVLDLSRILAGPWATQNLADLGATVIKIEKPTSGDDTRQWGPPFAKDRNGCTDTAAYFFCCNRGKRSVTLDFTKPEGAKVVRHLACQADVLVENFKVGGLAQYGLDSSSLRALNPRLIYCSITGFGQDGPYAGRPGYDALIQAMGGLMSITGEPDESPGGGPQKVGVAVVDLMTGLYATSAILAALFSRTSTGKGTHIDMSLLDVQVAALANQASSWLVADVCPSRLGSAHPSIAPYQPFACADGHVMLAIGNDAQFAAFCQAAECAQLVSDPRFRTNAARVQHRRELLTHLEPALRRKTCAEWTKLGDELRFPCGVINTVDQVFEDSQVRARGLVAELHSNRYGSVKSVVSPMRFDGHAACSAIPPPELGDSTEAVLQTCGYSAQQILELREHGVI